MDKIEEVKKILEEVASLASNGAMTRHYFGSAAIPKSKTPEEYAQQICQLIGNRFFDYIEGNYSTELMAELLGLSLVDFHQLCNRIAEMWHVGRDTKPSEDRLLSDDERSTVIQRDTTLWCPTKGEFLDEVGIVIAKAQHDLDRQYWQGKMRELVKAIEDNILWDDEMSCTLGIAPSGNKAFKIWQSLKEQYLGQSGTQEDK